jgi:hypothetical protein
MNSGTITVRNSANSLPLNPLQVGRVAIGAGCAALFF